MPSKRRPLPKGWFDAKAIAEMAKKRGIELKISTVRAALQRGKAKGIVAEPGHPKKRRIVQKPGADHLIRHALRAQLFRQMAETGSVVRLPDLAAELKLSASRIQQVAQRKINDGETCWVRKTEADRLRKKYAKRLEMLNSERKGLVVRRANLARQAGMKPVSMDGVKLKTIFDGYEHWVRQEDAERFRREKARQNRLKRNFVSPRAAGTAIGVAQQTIVNWIERGFIQAEEHKIKGRNVYRIPTQWWAANQATIKERAGYIGPPAATVSEARARPARQGGAARGPAKGKRKPRAKRALPKKREKAVAEPRAAEPVPITQRPAEKAIGQLLQVGSAHPLLRGRARPEPEKKAKATVPKPEKKRDTIGVNKAAFFEAFSGMEKTIGFVGMGELQREAERHLSLDPAKFRKQIIPMLLRRAGQKPKRQ